MPFNNVPDAVNDVWREARSAYGIGAYTASETTCRKILMHLAVDVAGAMRGKTFVEYVNVLDAEGYIAKGLRQVVDQIRTRGNTANHKLPSITEVEAAQTIPIVEYSLHSIYELPALAT